jgi:hypothetical protein
MHQPIDMVSAFSQRKDAVEPALSPAMRLKRWNRYPLHHVGRIVRAVLGHNAELNGQLVPIASHFADWYLDLIAGMKHEIETQLRLRGRDNARQIMPRLQRFETVEPGLK